MPVPQDFPDLRFWLAPEYRRHSWQENRGATPATIASSGNPVGHVQEPIGCYEIAIGTDAARIARRIDPLKGVAR